MRSGARMGDTKLIDSMVATLTDPFGVGHMGITAENLATKWGITREQQDALAVEIAPPRRGGDRRGPLQERRSCRSSSRRRRARSSSTPTST